MIFFVGYLVGMVALLVGFRMREIQYSLENREISPDAWWPLIHAGVPVALLWPVALPCMGVFAAATAGMQGMDKALHVYVEHLKARRERIALEEKRQQELADKARYAIEEGPHR